MSPFLHPPNRHRRPDAATTLVELIVALLIAGILLVSIGSIVAAAAEASVASSARLELERDVHLALNAVRRAVRAKSAGEIEIGLSGARLTLTSDSEAPESYYIADGDFVRAAGLAGEPLVSGNFENAAFSLEEGFASGQFFLRTTLRANDGNHSLQLEEITKLRN